MTTDTEKRLADDLVKRLRKRVRIMGLTVAVKSMPTTRDLLAEAADAIDRLTAERDAAWVGGTDAAAQFIRDTYDIVIDGSNSETELQLLEDLERDIRALSPSTLNKPE